MRDVFSTPARKRSRQTLLSSLAGLLLVLLAGQLVRVAGLYSANWDEAHHLYDGYRILTLHDYRANAEVPPLLKVAAAAPLLFLHPWMPPEVADPQGRSAFVDGRLFVFGNGGDRVLLPARVVCILVTLLTAGLIFAAGRRMFGVAAGLCAPGLFVFDPNVLAHGSLVSTDMGSACFLFAGVYAFYRFATEPGWKWLALTGLAAGLAMTVKFTGILIVPMLLLLAIAEGVRRRSGRDAAKLMGAALAAALCGWLVIWAMYGFRYAAAPGHLQLTPALGPYLAGMRDKSNGVKLAWLARFHLLPEAYLWGLANTKYTEWEYTSYFLGRVYRHGPWQYFPVAFLIKSTLPLLALLALAPFTWRSAGEARGQKLIFLLVPVGVYVAVITTSHFDIGARHLMPVYPFLYVLAGFVAAVLLRRGRAWALVVVVLLGWQVVTTERISPAFMAYGNEAWGGPLAVRRYLSDANVDWGQQLKTVKAYLDRNHITNCWFAYFPDGAVEPQDYGIPCKRLPTPSGLWWFRLPMTVPPVIHGTVLLSESVLDGVESGDGVLNPYDAFHQLRPVAVLQDGVYVYRGQFAIPLASAWWDVRSSKQMEQTGRVDDALALAQRGAALAPQSARVELQLGDALTAARRWPEAVAHYRQAQHDLETERPDLEGEELSAPISRGLRTALAQGR